MYSQAPVALFSLPMPASLPPGLDPSKQDHVPCSARTPGLTLGGLANVSRSKPKLSNYCQEVGLSYWWLVSTVVLADRDGCPYVTVEEAEAQRC